MYRNVVEFPASTDLLERSQQIQDRPASMCDLGLRGLELGESYSTTILEKYLYVLYVTASAKPCKLLECTVTCSVRKILAGLEKFANCSLYVHCRVRGLS